MVRFLDLAELKMEAAAATVVRSSATSCKPSFYLGRSSILAANGPGFARFVSHLQFSNKVLEPFRFEVWILALGYVGMVGEILYAVC